MRSAWNAAILAVISSLLMGSAKAWASPPEDEFYPAEESAQAKAVSLPRLMELRAQGVVLQWPGEPSRTLRVGQSYQDWEVVAIIPQDSPLAVLEHDFAHWGMLAYVGAKGPLATLRKSVGSLGSFPPATTAASISADRVLNARDDVLAQAIAGHEPSYQRLADLLPPLRAYTFLGTETSNQKMMVWPDGRLGYGVSDHHSGNVVFDPAQYLQGSLNEASGRKLGLVGGYLPAIDYGFSNAEAHSGWEEIAFGGGDGADLQVYVRLRTSEGRRSYWRLPAAQPTENGTEFYRALLILHQHWEDFLAQGIQVDVPERRVSDAAKAAIVRALISAVGLHPKYGVGHYAGNQHDTFPPATILLNQCLLDWGFTSQVKARLAYYLSHFVKPDGTFDYYGPALSEYGQLLALCAQYGWDARDGAWLMENLPALRRIADALAAQVDAAGKVGAPDLLSSGLLWGSAEADTREDRRFYFSSDLWCARGLEQLGRALTDASRRPGGSTLAPLGERYSQAAKALQASTFRAMDRAFQKDATPPFLPPDAGAEKPFERMTQDRLASYTNYRYWPEMLSPGLLPPELRDAIITFRVAHGGEVAGTTRLEDVLDDWPYTNYAWGLLEAGQIDHYLLGFYGHLALHETPGTLTSYESVNIKGVGTRSNSADYCVPAQLVEPQMLRWMLAWEPWDGNDLWLGRAVPTTWFGTGFSAHGIPTRWGTVSFQVAPATTGLAAQVEMASPHPGLVVHVCLRSLALPSPARFDVQGTRDWKWDPANHAIELRGEWKTVSIRLKN